LNQNKMAQTPRALLFGSIRVDQKSFAQALS
jgi:hypothetical protein